PSDRFTKHGSFVRPDGAVIASSWAALTDGGLDVAILVTENNVAVEAQLVFSGTKADGTYMGISAWDCSGWTHDTYVSGEYGHLGYSDANYDGLWSDLGGGNLCSDS